MKRSGTALRAFLKMYYISGGQTSLLQVQWDFYIGPCLYVAYFCKTGNM